MSFHKIFFGKNATGGIEEPLLVPISLEEQEVMCSNCFETIPMHHVDAHSQSCTVLTRPSVRPSHRSMRSSQFQDEEANYRMQI